MDRGQCEDASSSIRLAIIDLVQVMSIIDPLLRFVVVELTNSGIMATGLFNQFGRFRAIEKEDISTMECNR